MQPARRWFPLLILEAIAGWAALIALVAVARLWMEALAR